jgi:hypothetical protein
MKHVSALVLLAAGFLGTVTSASAQVARDGNFYEEVTFVNCPSSSSGCTLQFSAVPQLILFSKINCFIGMPNAAVYAVAFEIRDVSGGPTRRRELLPIPAPVDRGSGLSAYSIMTPTDFMVSASKFPVIEAFFTAAITGTGFFECKITGRLQ